MSLSNIDLIYSKYAARLHHLRRRDGEAFSFSSILFRGKGKNFRVIKSESLLPSKSFLTTFRYAFD